MEHNDRFAIDTHKLIYHIERVARWLHGEDIYPVYIDVGISGKCNHRCIFCAYEYNGYKSVFLPKGRFRAFVRCAASHGVKSIMFAGEGEPLLHPEAADFVSEASMAGLDTAITSNAVLFTRAVSRLCLPNLSWFRASIDAGTAETYAKIHRASSLDFNRVLANLADAVEIKKRLRLKCVIGGQFVLIRDNYNEAEHLAAVLRRIGLDYLIIKPYSRHPSSHNVISSNFTRKEILCLDNILSQYSRGKFNVIFRSKAFCKNMNQNHISIVRGCRLFLS